VDPGLGELLDGQDQDSGWPGKCDATGQYDRFARGVAEPRRIQIGGDAVVTALWVLTEEEMVNPLFLRADRNTATIATARMPVREGNLGG
jgi:hypothetical protein